YLTYMADTLHRKFSLIPTPLKSSCHKVSQLSKAHRLQIFNRRFLREKMLDHTAVPVPVINQYFFQPRLFCFHRIVDRLRAGSELRAGGFGQLGMIRFTLTRDNICSVEVAWFVVDFSDHTALR